MPSLRDLQLRFVAALYEGNDAIVAEEIESGDMPTGDRLGIYRNNLREGFVKALALEFPVIERLVGAEFFRRTALDFQLRHPSRAGDLTHIGEPFADYLRAQFGAGEFAWMPDVAALEWALECVANAPDAPTLGASALAAVPAHRYQDLIFEPSAAIRLIESRFPVVRIWQSNQPGSEPETIDLHAGAERVLVRRTGVELEFVHLDAADFTFARMLARRTPLGLATDASLAVDTTFDLTRALRALVLAGAFAHVALAD